MGGKKTQKRSCSVPSVGVVKIAARVMPRFLATKLVKTWNSKITLSLEKVPLAQS